MHIHDVKYIYQDPNSNYVHVVLIENNEGQTPVIYIPIHACIYFEDSTTLFVEF